MRIRRRARGQMREALLAVAGEPGCVDRIRFGVSAMAFDECLDARGVGPMGGKAKRATRLKCGPLIAARGFEHEKVARSEWVKTFEQRFRRIGELMAAARGWVVEGDGELPDVEAKDARRASGRRRWALRLDAQGGVGHDRAASDCLRARSQAGPLKSPSETKPEPATDPDNDERKLDPGTVTTAAAGFGQQARNPQTGSGP